MDKKEANQKISVLLAEARAKLNEAAEIARTAGTSFSWSGPAYGMGGYFDPEDTKDEWGEETNGWQASSHSC